MREPKHIYRQGDPNQRYSVGVGYLVIPSDTDRDAYIQRSLRLGKVMLLGKNGEVMLNVRIGKHLYSDLDFPESNEQLGSAIIWVNIPIVSEPIAIAVINKEDDSRQFNEHEFQLIRSTEAAFTSIIGKGDKGQLFINVHSNRDNGGEIFISVDNASNTGKIQVDVKGDVNVNAVGKINLQVTDEFNVKIADTTKDKKSTTLQYKKGKGLTYADEFGNIIIANKKNIQTNAKKRVNLGTGKEAIVLGETLKEFFDEFITEVSNTTVTTAIGIMPLMNKVQIAKFKAKTKQWLSKYSFTD